MIEASNVGNWWTCKQCGKSFEVDSKSKGYTVGGEGYYCFECFRDGIMWAIAMAYDARNEEEG